MSRASVLVVDDQDSIRHFVSKALEEDEQGGREEGDAESEKHDVPARRIAHGEELGALAEEVEERLCDREGPEGGQVEARP